MATKSGEVLPIPGEEKVESPNKVIANIRQKYPQYGDMTDQQLSAAIIKKYPQYKDVLGAESQPNETVSNVGKLYRGAHNALSYLPRKAFEGTGQLDVWSGIKTQEQADARAKAYGDFIADTLIATPVIAATGGLGALGRAVPYVGRLLPAAGRILGSAGLGAAQSAATGESPLSGAEWGAAGGAVGEGVGKGLQAVRKVYRGGKSLLPSVLAPETSQKLEDAAEVIYNNEANRITKKVEEALRSPHYFNTKDPIIGAHGGHRAIESYLDTALSRLEKSSVKGGETSRFIIPGSGSSRALSLKEATDALIALRDAADSLGGSAASWKAAQLWKQYEAGVTEIAKTLSTRNPTKPLLGTYYRQILANVGSKRAVIRAIENSLDSSGTRLDPVKWATEGKKVAAALARTQTRYKIPQALIPTYGTQLPPNWAKRAAKAWAGKPFTPETRAAIDAIFHNPWARSMGLVGAANFLRHPWRSVVNPEGALLDTTVGD